MTLIKRPRAGSQWVDVPATQLLLQLLNELYVRIFIQKQLRGLFVASEVYGTTLCEAPFTSYLLKSFRERIWNSLLKW